MMKARFSVAQLDGALGNGFKNRLQIERGTADDFEHLRRCRLFLQRLP